MPGNPLTDEHWADEVADQITGVVGKIRDNATNNAIVAVRAIVFGLLGAMLGIGFMVLLLISVTRGTQSLLDIWMGWPTAVYASYYIVGGLFVVLGALFMKKRY
jgi:hypothetical protein